MRTMHCKSKLMQHDFRFWKLFLKVLKVNLNLQSDSHIHLNVHYMCSELNFSTFAVPSHRVQKWRKLLQECHCVDDWCFCFDVISKKIYISKHVTNILSPSHNMHVCKKHIDTCITALCMCIISIGLRCLH